MTTDIEECRLLLNGGSRSFYAASLLLPRRIREPAAALYAFCRLADDAIDMSADAARALAMLRDRLDRIYRGCPSALAADRAFAAVVERFAIPQALPQALLEGFAWDAESLRYDTLEDLCEYAVRVAGTVGGMMTLLMGQREPAVLARAMDLGVAMQLTNIARDVGEDAGAGRLYLPGAWLREAGIDADQFMQRPAFCPALGSVVERLLRAADGLYARAEVGIAALPPACRPGIRAARVLYAEIGRQVERNKFDSVSQRAVVSGLRKCAALASAIPRAYPTDGLPAAPLGEALTLIDAVAAFPFESADETRNGSAIPWWKIGQRAVGVIELFERLERREQFRRANF